MKESIQKLTIVLITCLGIITSTSASAIEVTSNNNINTDTIMDENLNLTQEWDKVFPKSDKVNHSKVTFRNRYGNTLAADLYMKMQQGN